VPEQLPLLADTVDLIVNTTSVGMSPQVEQCPLPTTDWLSNRHLVSDLIYNPRETLLLNRAAAQGARTHGGLGMLIYQGAYAFEYWTGHAAPVSVMQAAVTEH
jgi:shikimate dehydrogenase